MHITTNNYGYFPTRITSDDKYQLQMYDEYANLLQQEGIKHALEIGSGAGGGLMHMKSRLPSTHFTGLDRCKEAIKTCQYFHDQQQKNILLYNDINDLFVDNKKFDAIVSVETGIYKNPEIFAPIHNLLNEKGVFVYYDNANAGKLDRIIKSIEFYGFRIEHLKDITENVFKACEYDTPRRLDMVEKYLPLYLKPFSSEILRYLCVKNTSRYVNFSTGKKRSFMLKARKIKNMPINSSALL